MSGLDEVQLLNGIKGLKLERVSILSLYYIYMEPLAECFFLLLHTFTNIESLYVVRHHSKAVVAKFPCQLLSFLKRNPLLGSRLEYVRIGFPPELKDFNEDSKAALEELQNKGIRLELNYDFREYKP